MNDRRTLDAGDLAYYPGWQPHSLLSVEHAQAGECSSYTVTLIIISMAALFLLLSSSQAVYL